MKTDNRSEDQAKAQLDSIKEMVQALHDAGDDEKARLIAAAPEMLAALRNILDAYNTDSFVGGEWDDVRTAIANAEGKL